MVTAVTAAWEDLYKRPSNVKKAEGNAVWSEEAVLDRAAGPRQAPHRTASCTQAKQGLVIPTAAICKYGNRDHRKDVHYGRND